MASPVADGGICVSLRDLARFGRGWLGRLAPGYAADVTVLAQDPAQTDPDDLITLPVLLTVVDGEIVYRGAQLG